MKKRILILANGHPPSKRLLRRLLKQSDLFVCADGGANTAARFGLRPDLIIGDLDSISSATLRKFRTVRAKRIADQNSTDLEKALSWATGKGHTDFVVAGATGRRLDHSLGNLSALVKFSRKARIQFVDDDSTLCFVGPVFEFEAQPGTVVSLIPLSLCEGVVTRGLKWELKNESLKLGFRESTSNLVKSSPVRISVRRGDLLLFAVRSAKALR